MQRALQPGFPAELGWQSPYFTNELVAIHIGQANVADNDIWPVPLYLF
jgi:hypothetical protein